MGDSERHVVRDVCATQASAASSSLAKRQAWCGCMVSSPFAPPPPPPPPPPHGGLQVARLALLSLFAVFKDIVPGYRIRPPSEKELEVKVG